MRKKHITILALASLLAVTTSCNDFLDKLPDNRAIVDTEKDINDLLTACYPTRNPNYILELSSDNVRDNGSKYNGTKTQQEAYHWQQVTSTSNDDSYSLWQNFYEAVGNCNVLLENIDAMGRENFPAQRAEALMCRAYSMFELSRTFCMAYNPETAKNELGLPYPEKSGTGANTVYTRGTLEELYAKIDADIEEALPNIDEAHLAGKSLKYHFNRLACYAFAARFNLNYQKFDKVVKYADVVLGTNPQAYQRDYMKIANLSAAEDKKNAFLESSEPANLMLQINYSIAGRAFSGSSSYRRYNHDYTVQTSELYWAPNIWGSSGNTVFSSLYGTRDYCQYFPKIREVWEVTDKVNGTGYAHTLIPVFSGEQLLLERAEALALLGRTDEALADANVWLNNHLRPEKKSSWVNTPLTFDNVNAFYDNLPYAEASSTGIVSLKKELHPQGFASCITDKTVENLIHVILQMRRIETVDYGFRFQDIKRYGISFAHNVEKTEDIVFATADKRGAQQLPEAVIQAGLEANPR